MCYSVSLSLVTGASETNRSKIITTPILQNPTQKTTRIEQMSDFCDKIMYLLTRNRGYI